MLIGDEEILATRIAAQRAQRHSILNEVTIDNQVYQFEQQEITFPSAPDCKFSIVLPQNIQPLSTEQLENKFPSNQRPEIVLSDENAALNATFSYTLEPPEKLEARLEQYQEILDYQSHNSIFFTENINELENGLTVAGFDVSENVLDGEIYYLYFFVDLPAAPRAEILGTFSCLLGLRDKWEPLFRQMIETISPIQ